MSKPQLWSAITRPVAKAAVCGILRHVILQSNPTRGPRGLKLSIHDHHAGYAISQRKRKRVEEIFG